MESESQGRCQRPYEAQGDKKMTTTVRPFTAEQLKRYSRHIIMPQVGGTGQRRLLESKVLLIGAGGLGSPTALYLAAAGVGTLGVVDFDVVDLSNLQRQILHGTNDVGRPKVLSAKETLNEINPDVRVVPYQLKLSSENIMEIIEGYDIVVDGSDNFATRYLVNDACYLAKKTNVHGSIFLFDGQATVFKPGMGCYRCLYPTPPPPGMVPSCAEGGVLGILPGIVGCMQANEAVKLLLGRGEPLIGRLILFDAMRMRFREFKLRKDPDCPICGPKRTIRELIDYHQFCGVHPEQEVGATEFDLTPSEVARRLETRNGNDLVLLDVRTPEEWEICRLPGAKLIPIAELPERVRELEGAPEIIAYCRSGQRSARAVELLRAAGYRRVWNMAGGILRWSDEVDPTVPKY